MTAGLDLKDALYADRFKSRIGNPEEDGTKSATPEGTGDMWFDHATNVLSLSNAAGDAWVDFDLDDLGGGSGGGPFFIGILGSDIDMNGTSGSIDWESEYDPDSEHDDVTNPERIYFASQSDGLYKVSLSMRYVGAADERFTIALKKNGAAPIYGTTGVCVPSGSGSAESMHMIEFIIDMTTSDYIEITYADATLTASCNLVSPTNVYDKKTYISVELVG